MLEFLQAPRATAMLLGQQEVLGQEAATSEKAICVWFNCTLGFLLLLAHREETEGAWVQFKKPVLGAMPVLDVVNVGPDKLSQLARAYDELAERPLEPFPAMATDPVRAALDDAVATTLHLPSLAPLRDLLAREPIFSLSLERLMPGGLTDA